MELSAMGVDELRRLAYQRRLTVNRLQRERSVEDAPATVAAIDAELTTAQSELFAAEEALARAEAQRASAQPKPDDEDRAPSPPETLRDGRRDASRRYAPDAAAKGERAAETTRSFETTGLSVQIECYMEHLPTAFYHLFQREQDPLIVYTVRTNDIKTRRLRMTSYVEGYTAKAIDTVEVKRNAPATIRQLPTLFPQAIHDLHELTRATLNVLTEDLAADHGNRIEIHRTMPIWLLARTTAPRQIRDAVTGEAIDLSRYLAAYVTPNEPSVMAFQRSVAARHYEGRLRGYGGDVESQVEAIYNAIKEDLNLAYVHSPVGFNLDDGARSQRIRLPRECIADKTGNCIDVTLLMASLLEGIALNPAIVLAPGHAFVGWQKQAGDDDWAYLETTMLQTNSFREALEAGIQRAQTYRHKLEQTGNPRWFRRLNLSELRVQDHIIPME